VVLTVGSVEGTICYFQNLWDLVLVIFSDGERYSYIRVGLSRR